MKEHTVWAIFDKKDKLLFIYPHGTVNDCWCQFVIWRGGGDGNIPLHTIIAGFKAEGYYADRVFVNKKCTK